MRETVIHCIPYFSNCNFFLVFKMFESWEKVQQMTPKEAAEIIYVNFKKQRFPDEIEATHLFAEHMVEVGQYLRRKATERAERAGKQTFNPMPVTNSKFWYEVRKKINEVLEQERMAGNKPTGPNDDDSDNENGHPIVSPQTSFDIDTEVPRPNYYCIQ